MTAPQTPHHPMRPRSRGAGRLARTAAGAACGLVVSAAPAPATASPAAPASEPVTITATQDLGEVGRFTTDGGPCASGSTSEPGGVHVRERRRLLSFDLDKLFTCDDGSGTFTIRIHAVWQPCRPSDRGVWAVVSGTGQHADLRGNGILVGTYYPGPCDEAVGITDVLTGHLG